MNKQKVSKEFQGLKSKLLKNPLSLCIAMFRKYPFKVSHADMIIKAKSIDQEIEYPSDVWFITSEAKKPDKKNKEPCFNSDFKIFHKTPGEIF